VSKLKGGNVLPSGAGRYSTLHINYLIVPFSWNSASLLLAHTIAGWLQMHEQRSQPTCVLSGLQNTLEVVWRRLLGDHDGGKVISAYHVALRC